LRAKYRPHGRPKKSGHSGHFKLPQRTGHRFRQEALGGSGGRGRGRELGPHPRPVGRLIPPRPAGAWSDREIARRCKVSNHFVSKVKKDLTGSTPSEKKYVNRQGTVSTMNTANIGKGQENRMRKSDWAVDCREAARLKFEGDGLSTKEIAERFGFSNPESVLKYVAVGFYPDEVFKIYNERSFVVPWEDVRNSLTLRIPPAYELQIRGGRFKELGEDDYARFDYSEVVAYFQAIAEGELDTREKRQEVQRSLCKMPKSAKRTKTDLDSGLSPSAVALRSNSGSDMRNRPRRGALEILNNLRTPLVQICNNGRANPQRWTYEKSMQNRRRRGNENMGEQRQEKREHLAQICAKCWVNPQRRRPR